MIDDHKEPRLYKGQLTRSEIYDIANKRERKQRAELAAANPNLGFLAREFVQCTFPYTKPKSEVFIRTNNLTTVMMKGGNHPRTGVALGLSYGLIPRYFMVHLNRQAVLRQSREIPLGNNLHLFMRRMGLNPESGSGKRSDHRRMVDQITRLLNTTITFSYDDDPSRDHPRSWPFLIAADVDLWWNAKLAEVDTIFESRVLLSEQCFDAFTSNPVPIELDTLAQLGRSPLAIDLYCWIGYRLFLVNQKAEPARIPLRELKKQFGADYPDTEHGRREFNRYFRKNFDKVSAIYNGELPLIYSFDPGVITLYPKGTRLPRILGG